MRIYQCDSCNKIIPNPHNVKMKEFYVDSTYFNRNIIPIERKRKIKIQLCDDCYKGLNLIAEKREYENNV